MQEHPLEQARRWLAQAKADLAHARRAAEDRGFDLTLFLSQPCAEKALKAALIWQCGDHARTHVIADLLAELREADAAVAGKIAGIEALDAYYQSTRYPGALGGAVPALTFQREEAELALSRATNAVDVVSTHLASESA